MQNGNRQFKLPFYRQERPDSCVPACLRMVLAGLIIAIDGEAGIHAMVAIAADDRYVQVYDPLVGERQLEKMMFDTAWGMTNRLTILIPGQGLATD
jgi:hypothetical protein